VSPFSLLFRKILTAYFSERNTSLRSNEVELDEIDATSRFDEDICYEAVTIDHLSRIVGVIALH
jgi:hypothetical protein